MYERLQRLYKAGRLTETELQNAVTKGWITAEQMQGIMAPTEENYDLGTETE